MTNAGMEDLALVRRCKPAKHQPDQRRRRRWVASHRVVSQPRIGRGAVSPHSGDFASNRRKIIAKRCLGIVRVLAVQEGEPAGSRDALSVCILHRPVKEFHDSTLIRLWPVVV